MIEQKTGYVEAADNVVQCAIRYTKDANAVEGSVVVCTQSDEVRNLAESHQIPTRNVNTFLETRLRASKRDRSPSHADD